MRGHCSLLGTRSMTSPKEGTAGSIGILAYGSLMSDPGPELLRVLTKRIATTTPFPVEYARLSRTRGGAPTVVPCKFGRTVSAEVLVPSEDGSLAEGKRL